MKKIIILSMLLLPFVVQGATEVKTYESIGKTQKAAQDDLRRTIKEAKERYSETVPSLKPPIVVKYTGCKKVVNDDPSISWSSWFSCGATLTYQY